MTAEEPLEEAYQNLAESREVRERFCFPLVLIVGVDFSLEDDPDPVPAFFSGRT